MAQPAGLTLGFSLDDLEFESQMSIAFIFSFAFRLLLPPELKIFLSSRLLRGHDWIALGGITNALPQGRCTQMFQGSIPDSSSAREIST